MIGRRAQSQHFLFWLTLLAFVGIGVVGTLAGLYASLWLPPLGSVLGRSVIGLVAALALFLLSALMAGRRLRLSLLLLGWYLSRMLLSAIAAVVWHERIDAMLLDAASFGALRLENGRLVSGVPSVLPFLAVVVVLALGYRWGQRRSEQPGHAAGPAGGLY